MVRKILAERSEKQVKEDLEGYRQKAIELGATDAKIITTDQIIIDGRVRAKCYYPPCYMFGSNIYCPPNSMSVEEVRKLVSAYNYALFVMKRVPSENVAGPGIIVPTPGLYQICGSLEHRLRQEIVNLNEIVATLEAGAFYDGYHLAMAFGCGSCKFTLCNDKLCNALQPGKPCIHPLKAKPSVQGMAMDVFTMAAKLGWDIYPIGPGVKPEDVPYGTRLAAVLIT